MWHAIFLVEINPERTVTPQSHALSISGLTAAIKTPTLRKTIKVMRKSRKSRRRWIKLNLKKKPTLPAQHHTCSHPVCGHYEDTKREILLKQFFNFFSNVQHFWAILQSGLLYLTGVSRAGLWNVAFVHSFTARHTSQLILSKGTDNVEIKQWNQSIFKGLCWLCHIISETTHLAVPAAQPVAAHGIVGKSTLLTAVGSAACTLLPFTEEWL